MAALETGELFFLGDVKPELDKYRAVGDELVFEFIDLAVGSLSLVVGAEPLQPLNHYLPTPA